MLSSSLFVLLPAPLLLLLSSVPLPAVCAQELRWPYNLPPQEKYYPEDEEQIRRHEIIQQKFVDRAPNRVRKMSADPGEMFFPEYWGFDSFEEGDEAIRSDWAVSSTDKMVEGEEAGPWDNSTTISQQPQPPLRLHASGGHASRMMPRWTFGSRLAKRAFTCPAGTTSCASIGSPNTCCATFLTCQKVASGPLGDVGCCADGSDCSGAPSSCPSDYATCSESLGGGCCIPGYACSGVGCVETSTATVVITPVVTVSPTSTSTSTSATCASGFHSCPVSLGGGCCATDRACASSSCAPLSSSEPAPLPPPVTSSTAPAAPLRPTSAASATAASSSTSSTTPSVTIPTPCPSNFYPCSAYFPGAGCCQIGRDCASTSCPARTTISKLVSDGVTIIVEPTGPGVIATVIPGSGAAAASGSQQTSASNNAANGACASAWSTCAPSLGGGCCPGGYACGSVSCTSAGASATQEISKQSSGASSSFSASYYHKLERRWWFIAFVGLLHVAALYHIRLWG